MSQPPVIVVGAGGHAAVVADALLAAGRHVLGFLDREPALMGRQLLGLPILGDDDALAAHRPQELELANGLGSDGTPAAVFGGTRRRRVQERLQAAGWRFTGVRHPSAVVASSARVAVDAQVLAGAVVQPLATVGAGAIVNTRAVVEHHASVGAFAHVASGAILCGQVAVGDECHVGAGAVVRQGLALAGRVVVGAGAVVVAAVSEGAVVGAPARPLAAHRSEEGME